MPKGSLAARMGSAHRGSGLHLRYDRLISARPKIDNQAPTELDSRENRLHDWADADADD
ncbi:hypothetical protein NONI108955_36105 [Nocardia ninae]|uniref:Uncharacterized protein n=1 Tax=Nocardia ninae NBRC 108245 TaxID=1210091 RepID=A0A511MLN0_9NOCA|nr:hypothetical protein NN4_60540 [Nocardia ninae NBRC 108245]